MNCIGVIACIKSESLDNRLPIPNNTPETPSLKGSPVTSIDIFSEEISAEYLHEIAGINK